MATRKEDKNISIKELTDDVARSKAGGIISKKPKHEPAPAPAQERRVSKRKTQAHSSEFFVPDHPTAAELARLDRVIEIRREVKRDPIAFADVADKKEAMYSGVAVTKETTLEDFVTSLSVPWPVYPEYDTQVYDWLKGVWERRVSEAGK